MSPKNLVTFGGKTFEDLRQINNHGAEYWSTRDLQPLPGYSQWRRLRRLALAFGDALRTGPELWLNLQRDWDLWHSMRNRHKVPPLKRAG